MTELRTPPRRLPPEFEDEEDVDLGRYWRLVAARWWLLLAGLVAGLIVGYLVSLGSGSVWQATALLYLGNPVSLSGNPIQSLATNPRTVNEIVHSEAAVKTAAARSGLRTNQLRGHISTKAISGGKGTARTGTGQLMQVTVQGDGARKVAVAANTLGLRVVRQTSDYVDSKIRSNENRVASLKSAIASVDKLITTQRAVVRNSASLAPLDQLVLISQLNNAQLQRAQFVEDLTTTEQALAFARDVEKPQIVEFAAAKKTTAQSPRNAMLVGGILGVLIGAILALVWDRLPLGAARRV
jgi:hypothetical protein